jgi:hypothetical protein
MILGSVATLAIVAAILIAVFVPGSKNGDNNTASSSTSPESSGDESWTPGTFGPEYDAVREKISPFFPLNQKNIPTSKLQEDALLWLTYEDTYPEKDNLTPELLLERFVMALMYNATDGGTWLQPDQWLAPTSVCEWGTTTTTNQVEAPAANEEEENYAQVS